MERILKRTFQVLAYRRLSLVHTNPSRKRSFLKTLLKLETFENTGFAFLCDRKYFDNRSFTKTICSHDNVPNDSFFFQTQTTILAIVVFVNSSGVTWTENIWWVYRVKPALFSNSFGVISGGAWQLKTCAALPSPLPTVLGVIFKHNVSLQFNSGYLAREVSLNFLYLSNVLSLSCLLGLPSL